jgi:hypothetical protein
MDARELFAEPNYALIESNMVPKRAQQRRA